MSSFSFPQLKLDLSGRRGGKAPVDSYTMMITKGSELEGKKDYVRRKGE